MFTVASGTLQVQLSDNAAGSVSGDAVRVVREGTVDYLAAPKILAPGESIELTARVIDPGQAVESVAFYYDSNFTGKIEPESDRFLGRDFDGSDGWSLSVPSDDLPPGYHVFFAQANIPAGPVNWCARQNYLYKFYRRGDSV